MPETAKPAARLLEPTELLTLLLEVSERISSTLDLDELMTRIAESIRRAIDYEVFAILLLHEKTKELRVRFSIGHHEELVRTLRIKVGEGIVGRAAALGRSVLVNDVRHDPSYIESLPGVRSELAVPLVIKKRVIGVLDLEASETDYFTPQHQNLVELLAGRMAMALENARLYRRSVRQARTLALLNEISRELSSVLVLNELLQKVGALTKRLIDYDRFSILLTDDRSETLKVVISMKQDIQMPAKSTVPITQGIVGAVARARETLVVPDVTRDPRYISIDPQTKSEMAVPLIHRGRVIGVVDLESPQRGYFTDEHVRLLSTLAPQITIAIENARLYEQVVKSEARMERDLERAREIQRHMMPSLCPSIPGLEVCVRLEPARELGGDLYDFLSYGKERQALTLGDVTGKGAPAALYGAMATGILRSLAPQRLPAPEVLRKLNQTLVERKIDGHFVTLLFAVWEIRTRTLRLANAGMPLPILVRAGNARAIRVEGVPLGLLENTEYQATSLVLESGDLLAMFSDGLVEAANRAQEEFEARRLENLLRVQARRPLSKIVEAVFSEVARFEEGRPRRDDQTLLLVRVR